MSGSRLFPMLEGASPLPWPIAKAVWRHLYVEIGHGDQSLERIAERDGFAYSEIEYMAKQLEKHRQRRKA